MPPEDRPKGTPRKGDEAAYAYARQLLENGFSEEDVHEKLLKLRLDSATASDYVAELSDMCRSGKKANIGDIRRSPSDVLRERARRNMVYGAFWLGGGLIVTFGTHALFARDGGGWVFA
ncbi:MAG: hypothetical protein K2R98_26410 [Gemmataceae bacterium]|nr:hypothetical protein [Gemmataceae bacterium]